MRKMLILMLTFLLLITLIPAKQAEASTGHHTVNVKTTLNVRENPSPRAKVVGSLKNGAVVYVYNTEPGGWSKIKYNNKAGYVASGYLTPNGSSSSDNSGGEKATVTASPSLNVRANPSPKAKIIGSLKKGAIVYIYGTEPGGWSKIMYNGRYAYVASSYLKKEAQDSTYYSYEGYASADANNLNVRATASKKGKVIGQVNRGYEFYVYGTMSNGWAEVDYNGRTAYVATEYLYFY
ncbi:SH3 domain-containing protein [Domibacillus aminovorans]|uniref:SH3b domain-containing protein n=1 Tax=Domibacillus aminovorans TaxID=29332 RepID=A0A177L022_9BACI|nr:SH3 domain-containing protein [Domibacillus aminovorans]OAH58953.1 hypothetical protein AWH49_04625 [Domibacillus aminovorans]